jgi:hypothetical protein
VTRLLAAPEQGPGWRFQAWSRMVRGGVISGARWIGACRTWVGEELDRFAIVSQRAHRTRAQRRADRKALVGGGCACGARERLREIILSLFYFFIYIYDFFFFFLFSFFFLLFSYFSLFLFLVFFF